MSDDLPKPLIGAEVDLRDFRFMPLDVIQLANSETWAMADGWTAKAAVNLWCRAWHQVPAGSLPDNENLQRTWAAVPDWDAVKEIALRGFIKCSDGRLYHRVICEKAKEAWTEKQRYRKAAKARWKKKKTNDATHDRRNSDADATHGVEEHATHMQETGTGTGTGRGKEEVPSSGSKEPSEARQADPVDLADPKVQLYRRGQEVLGKSAGGQITNLVKACGGSIPKARAALETASTRASPAEYVAAIIRGRRTDEDEAAIRDRNIAAGLSL